MGQRWRFERMRLEAGRPGELDKLWPGGRGHRERVEGQFEASLK